MASITSSKNCIKIILLTFLAIFITGNLLFFKGLYKEKRTQLANEDFRTTMKDGPTRVIDKQQLRLQKETLHPSEQQQQHEEKVEELDDPSSYYSHVLNEMVPNYFKLYQQPHECEGSFSPALYSSWRSTKTTYCHPLNNNPKNSRVDCYRYKQPNHSGSDIFCTMENVVLDFSKVTSMTKQCRERWGVEGCDRYYDFRKGSIMGSCERGEHFNTDKKWPIGHFQQLNRPFFNGFESVSEQAILENKELLTIDNTVMLVARDGAFNTYHSMEDYVNAFVLLETLQMNQKKENLDVLIMDQEVDGPYTSIFEKAFSHRSKNFKTRIISQEWIPKEEKVFFKKVIVNLPGVSSPLVKDISRTNPCGPKAELFVTFGRHILRSFGFKVPNYQRKTNMKPEITTFEQLNINLTIIDRKYHPFRKDVTRGIRNLANLVQALKETFSSIIISNKKVTLNVNAIDLATIPFEKQLEIIYNTQILVGVHGAGITHGLFMAGGANVLLLDSDNQIPQSVCGGGSIIEIPPMYGKHYVNLARWTGRFYQSAVTPSPNVSINEIVSLVRNSLKKCVNKEFVPR